MQKWMRWIAGTLIVIALVTPSPGCTNDRKQINDHQQALESEKD